MKISICLIGYLFIIGIDFGWQPEYVPLNNFETPMFSSVIDTISPQYFGLP